MTGKKLNFVYIVLRGRIPGVYLYNENWYHQIYQFPKYNIKKFTNLNEAIKWWKKNDVTGIIQESQIKDAFKRRDAILNNLPVPQPVTPPVSLPPPVVPAESKNYSNIQRIPLQIYTDGSVMGEKKEAGGWAGVILVNNTQCFQIHGCKKGKFNSEEMELVAVYKVLKILKKDEWNLNDAIVYTDCQYIQTHWLKNRKPKEKRKIWKKVWKLLIKYNISIQWVKGHSGNPHNESCDKMARKEATKLLEILQIHKYREKK